MSNGVVTQIIGAVIDVEFDRENIPNIYEALNIVGLETVLEVQQQLGDGIVTVSYTHLTLPTSDLV